MDHTEAIEVIQKALSSSQRQSHQEDNTIEAFPSLSPTSFAKEETGKINSTTSSAFKTF